MPARALMSLIWRQPTKPMWILPLLMEFVVYRMKMMKLFLYRAIYQKRGHPLFITFKINIIRLPVHFS